jgi:hypothetical protein
MENDGMGFWGEAALNWQIQISLWMVQASRVSDSGRKRSSQPFAGICALC